MADGRFNNIYATGFVSAAGNVTGGLLKSSSHISAVGNVTGASLIAYGRVSATGNIQTAGNVVAARYYGNGAFLSGITATNAQTAIVVTGSNQANITRVGTLSGLDVNGSIATRNLITLGNVGTTGNIYANVILTSRNISAGGNVTAINFIGNGSQLTNIVANTSINSGTVTSSSQPNITQVGTLNSLSVYGTTGAYNFNASGSIQAVGNISGNYILGNGAFLTGITAISNNAVTAQYVSANAQANITSVGTLTSLTVNGLTIVRNLSTSGTVTAANFVGNGSQLTGISGSSSGRVSLQVTTNTLSVGSSANVNITGYKGYALYSIQTSSAAWVTVYVSNATRLADANRQQGVDPNPGSGVVGEIISNSDNTLFFTPAVVGFNADNPVSTNIPLKVVNNGVSSSAITITLTLVKLES
jgi:hypothetical protein